MYIIVCVESIKLISVVITVMEQKWDNTKEGKNVQLFIKL